METVCHSSSSGMAYPEVTPNATAWVWSDKIPDGKETVTVTAHGLRRLLRVAARAYGFAATTAFSENPKMKELYARDATPEKAAKLLNELSSIWCEGDLVMSRLFVDAEGRAIVHPDEEVDQASLPPTQQHTHTTENAE